MANPLQPFCVKLRSRAGAWIKRPLPLKFHSAANKLVKVLEQVEDIIFEKRYGLSCRGFIERSNLVTSYHAALQHSQAYEAVSCAAIRELIHEAKKTQIKFENFVDLGSGKGKACFYAANKVKFRKIIGVEFSSTLVEAANSNVRRFSKKASDANISFINGDAAGFTLPPGNSLIFLFNPFDKTVLSKFLIRNMDHFRRADSVIAYVNDKQRLCLAENGFVALFRDQDSQRSLHQYSLYRHNSKA